MSIKIIAISSVITAFFLFTLCSDESNTVTPVQITTTNYQGVLSDPILAAAMGNIYTGSYYKYAISSNDSFAIQMNVGFGWAMVESGTCTKSGSTYTFTPKVNKVNNPATHQMENAAALRPVYTGVVNANQDTLTINSFINIGDMRPLGILSVVKQAN
jgi:hypothetical protein